MPDRQVGKKAWHTTYTFYYGKVRLTKAFKKLGKRSCHRANLSDCLLIPPKHKDNT